MEVLPDATAADAEGCGDTGAGKSRLVESHHLSNEFIVREDMLPYLDTVFAKSVCDGTGWASNLICDCLSGYSCGVQTENLTSLSVGDEPVLHRGLTGQGRRARIILAAPVVSQY